MISRPSQQKLFVAGQYVLYYAESVAPKSTSPTLFFFFFFALSSAAIIFVLMIGSHSSWFLSHMPEHGQDAHKISPIEQWLFIFDGL